MEKNAVLFAGFTAAMLATPLILFVIAWARDSVLLVDFSGALFGIDAVLVYWMYDQQKRAREAMRVPVTIRKTRS